MRDGSFVGVLAEREELAIAAAAKLRAKAVWKEIAGAGGLPRLAAQNVTSRTILKEIQGSPPAGKSISASYSKPFIAHASIGPSCAIARLKDGKLEVWTHSQGIFGLRPSLRCPRMKLGDIVVHHAEGAGCYGHNGADDVALDAALLARAANGRPVKLQWMREDEFAWEPYGPAMALDLEATLDASGASCPGSTSSGATATPTGPAARPSRADRGAPSRASVRLRAGDRSAAAARGRGTQRHPALRLPGSPGREALRARHAAARVFAAPLGAYGNVFAIESFMDELATEAGVDPVEFRLKHLKDPRARAVLEALKDSWRGKRRTAATASVLPRYKNIGAYCAVLAEVEACAAVPAAPDHRPVRRGRVRLRPGPDRGRRASGAASDLPALLPGRGDGVENLPPDGSALIVANHSGTVPIDALMLTMAVHDETPARRHLRLLGADLVFRCRCFEVARKAGSTLACNPDAERLLRNGEYVGCSRRASRASASRTGTGTSCSASAAAGSSRPRCAPAPRSSRSRSSAPRRSIRSSRNVKPLAKVTGLPYVPVTPLFPWLGPLGMLPLPSKWLIEFGKPIETAPYAEDADDPIVVFNLADQVRETIQETLHELLERRPDPFT